MPTPQPQNTIIDAKTSEEQFLADVIAQAAAGKVQASLVAVHGHVLDLLMDGDFEDCDYLLSRIDTERTDTDILLSFVISTANVSPERLPGRAELFKKVRNRLADEIGEPEAADAIDRFA